MKIGIDLDGVFFDIQKVEKEICRRNNQTWAPAPDWHFSHYSDDLRKQIFAGFCDSELMVDMIGFLQPVSMLQDTMRLIKQHGQELYIISARSEKVSDKTVELVKSHFGEFITDIYVGDMKSKIPKLKEFGIEIMIDDSPKVIEECLDNQIIPIMISNEFQLYNHYLRDRVIWCDKFSSIYYSLFLELQINVDTKETLKAIYGDLL